MCQRSADQDEGTVLGITKTESGCITEKPGLRHL